MRTAFKNADPILAPSELAQFAAVLADWDAPAYRCVRAIVAVADDTSERLARASVMGREFVVDVRRRARSDGAAAVLRPPPDVHERMLEAATQQLVATGAGERLCVQQLVRDTGIPRRTVYNRYSGTALSAACRRRAHTVWRAHFETTVLHATPDARGRLYAMIDVFDAWVASARFGADERLFARASSAGRTHDDELREHLAEIERFAQALAAAAGLASPVAAGAWMAMNVAGATAWLDRRDAARSAAAAFLERELARRC